MTKLTEAQRRALFHMKDRQFARGEFYRKNLAVHPITIGRLERAGLVETHGDIHNERIVDLFWRLTDAGRAALNESAPDRGTPKDGNEWPESKVKVAEQEVRRE
ncbi:hypothetical protein [Parvibaculum sp.]|uniref:hypothetical protein n=1 Tax=Parvibaculum sp. TaxID=2024848 RepID=UPI003C771DC7